MDRRNFVKMAGVAAAAGATGCVGGGNGNGDGNGDGGNGDGGNGDGGNGDGGNGNGGPASTEGQDGNYADMTGQDEVTIDTGAGPQGFKFDPADVTIDAGTTVRWVWTGEGGQHNVVEADGEEPLDDPSFESELVGEEGHEYSYTFEESGTFDYVCSVHINQGMIGSVQVEGNGGGNGDGGMEGNETDGGMNGGMEGNETDGSDGNESM
jgi:halocyanin-like protein